MNKIKISSNRNFGLVFFFVFLIVSIWPIISGESIRIWSVAISLVFLILGLMNSKVLTPLNKLWFKFGIILGAIVAPVIMSIIFF